MGSLRLLVLGLALCASGCVDPRAEDPAWRVLLVTVQGSVEEPGEGPALVDAWARSQTTGTLLEQVWCASGSVRSNGATLMVGGGPWLHGITDDLGDRTALPASLPSRAFAEDAWTGAVVAVPPLARAGGIEEGFERCRRDLGERVLHADHARVEVAVSGAVETAHRTSEEARTRLASLEITHKALQARLEEVEAHSRRGLDGCEERIAALRTSLNDEAARSERRAATRARGNRWR